ncbi:MAG: formyltransferase family protein [Candidatus Fimimonas sp.]
MGTPDFAQESLKELVEKNYNILAVVTNPDKPQGRGMKLAQSPVKQYALEKQIPIYQPEKVKNNVEFIEEIKKLKPDVICVVAYGKILPKEITLQGLTVADKTYDGTTKAGIAKMGTLCGVCEGDSVAVGSLEIAFDNANLGLHGVSVKNVKLVGYDKDNYVVKTVDVNNARITADERLLKKLGK